MSEPTYEELRAERRQNCPRFEPNTIADHLVRREPVQPLCCLYCDRLLHHEREEDIQTIMDHTKCSRVDAIGALDRNKNIVDACIELSD
jgi:hypothetical protein